MADAAGRSGRSVRFSWRPDLAGLAAMVAVLGGLSIGLQRLDDNSFLTHLATGRLIVDGTLPTTDPYSFTASGEPWVVQSWLISAVYGLADELAGGHGLVVLNGALTGLLGALVWRLTRPAVHVGVRFGLTVVSLVVGAGTWTERPLLVGLVALSAVLVVTREEWDPRWLVPVMWVWVNSHGSFPIGLGVLVLLALGSRLDGVRRPVELRYLGWATAGVAAGALNPLGPRLLVFPLQLLARSEALQYINEWQAPNFDDLPQRAFLVLIAAVVLAARRRPSWQLVTVSVVVIVAALTSGRNMAVASVALVPVLAAAFDRPDGGLGQRRSPPVTVAVVMIGALIAVTIGVALARLPFEYQQYPVAAVAWMDSHRLLGPETRVVAPDIAGNFLEAVYGSAQPVFFDDRVDMYPLDVVEDAVALQRARPNWSSVLADTDPDAVLWRSRDPLAQLLSSDPGWAVGYDDGRWMVAVPAPVAAG